MMSRPFIAKIKSVAPVITLRIWGSSTASCNCDKPSEKQASAEMADAAGSIGFFMVDWPQVCSKKLRKTTLILPDIQGQRSWL
jgi:hypothetical protein